MTLSARPWFAAVALTAAAALVAGCGTPTAGTGASGSQPISMMPSANDFVSSVIRTRDLGTAKASIDVRTTVGSTSRDLTGVGTVATDPGFGTITWTDAGGQTREIVNDVAIFVQTDPPDGTWTRLAKGDTTPTTGFANPLSGLGTLESVTNEGADVVEGVATTRYTGYLAVDPNRLADLGLSDEEITGIGDAWQGASMRVTAWVDVKGRVVRVDRAFEITGQDGIPVTVDVSTGLSAFSDGIDLTSPPSESVTEAPERQ